MSTLLLYLFISLFTLYSYSFPVVCVGPLLDLVVSTNCSDPRLYKLSSDLCSTVYQPLDIQLFQTTRIHLAGLDLTDGFPLSHLSQSEIETIPILKTILSNFCNGPISNGTNLGGVLSSSSVFITLMDASKVPSSNNKKDGTEQFFDDATTVHEFEFEADPNLNFQDLLNYFKLSQNANDLSIYSTKLYWRFMTYLPKDKVEVEMQEAKADPTHTPSLYWSFLYYVMGIPIATDDKYEIKHEVLEFCLLNKADQKTYHFVMDRGAKEIPLFHSQIRMIYTREGDGCHLDSTLWSDYTAGKTEDGNPQLNLRKGNEALDVSFDRVVKVATEYLTHFPVYNTLYNCQHFATNVFDLISDDSMDFESWDIMEAHSIFSNANGPKLMFLDAQEME